MNYYSREDIDFVHNPIDPDNVRCLRRIVDQTGASIVLTSSWRGGWTKGLSASQQPDLSGKLLQEALEAYDLHMIDKTKTVGMGLRPEEVVLWLRECPGKVEGMVIIDDGPYLWKKQGLDSFWVQTDFETNGLTDTLADRAIEILKRYPLRLRWRNLQKKTWSNESNRI